MRKYLFQRFLPGCNTEDIDLENLLLDNRCNAHEVSVSALDEKIDTAEDLYNFLHSFSLDDIIVLIYDRPDYNNPVLCDYANKTFKSYLYWIRYFGYRCYWSTSKTA